MPLKAAFLREKDDSLRERMKRGFDFVICCVA